MATAPAVQARLCVRSGFIICVDWDISSFAQGTQIKVVDPAPAVELPRLGSGASLIPLGGDNPFLFVAAHA
jgi:hypothetical protein